MIELNGVHLSYYPFKTLTKHADLIYYDGPLLSWFKDSNNQNWFYVWRDCDETSNRWFIFYVSDTQADDYINGKLSLLQLLKHTTQGFVVSVDIEVDNNGNLVYKNIKRVLCADIPEQYLPEVDSFYDKELMHHE